MTEVGARRFTFIGVALLAALALSALAAGASAAPVGGKASKPGTLTQLEGPKGCLVDRRSKAGTCGSARALDGPGPFMGSRAIALSPDGAHVYVASANSNAIAIFARDRKTGALRQAPKTEGCIAAKGAAGCARALGLLQPNSVALSPDGRNVYATSRLANSVTVFRRNAKTGALRQLPFGTGCVSSLPIPGCAVGRALLTPDVLVVSPDGANVYAGSFFGNSIATFTRNAETGALTQPGGSAGCIAEEAAASGCAQGIALKSVEGLAISPDGTSVYAATALSNAVVELSRDTSGGALSQATDGSGCIVDAPLSGCGEGRQLAGANAVAVSPDGDDVYVTSLFSNSVTSFSRSASSGVLTQMQGTAGCLVYLRAVGCSFGRALIAPEGLAVSPDGRNVYVAAFKSGAIAVLDRGGKAGSVAQKPGAAGCVALTSLPGCAPARALKGVSSIALSPDGRHLYSTAYESDAVNVFRRK